MSNTISRLSLLELESEPDRFRQKLFDGLKEHGFVILRDHTINSDRLVRAYELVSAFFDLPEQTKLKYDSGSGGERGYIAFGRENAKGNPHSDLKEFWHIGPEVAESSPYAGIYTDNVWPKEIPEFEPCFRELYTDLERLGKTLLEAVGVELGVRENFFRDMVTDGQSILRLLHYPRLEGLNTENAMRAAPHADINLLTLLVGATDSGLELYDRRGNWLPVQCEADEIVLDTGDMMSRLTNDVLPSTIHRVVNPPNQKDSRYSMPFFLHPHSEASLDCLPQCAGKDGPKYSPITAGEFLRQRLQEIGLTY